MPTQKIKIAIIGGGISGCTAYLSLKRYLSDSIDSITIYEAYSTPYTLNSPSPNNNNSTIPANAPTPTTPSPTQIIGGGLALSPNGLHVLSRLDPTQSLVQDIVRSGYAISTTSLKTKTGRVLLDLDARSDSEVVVEPLGPRMLMFRGDRNCRMHMVASSRHALWRCLRARVPDADVVTKRVQSVVPRCDKLNIVRFEDGEQVEVDLVVGADGLRSVTRRGMFGRVNEEGEEVYRYGEKYEGLLGVGGFTPLPPSLHSHLQPGTMSLLFSGNGFFGYFPSTSASSSSSPYSTTTPGETLSWWSTYAYPNKPPTPTPTILSSITTDLQARHATWTDPIVQSILPSLTVTQIYPTFTSPVLPTWEKHGVVLIGDAAHALPTTSGQGASQAVEDCEALGLFLEYYLDEEEKRRARGVDGERGHGAEVMQTKKVLVQAARKYVEVRKPHVKEILDAARRRQDSKRDIGWVGEKVLYLGLWVKGLLQGKIWRQDKQIINYDVYLEVGKVIRKEKDSHRTFIKSTGPLP